MEKFKKLKLSENILKAIEESKFTEPSEIQEKTIPLVIEGKDVVGQSATGSGKTLAFGAGIIQNVKKGSGVQALILTPTRELTEQVAKSLKIFSKHYALHVVEIYGGVNINTQMREIPKADIIVGTPGRILDHLTRQTLELDKLKFLVLDEADRMLDMGFIRDVEKIIQACPEERQTLLFSATVSVDIQRLSKQYMKNPEFVSVESYVDPSKLEQVYYDVEQNKKFSLLVHLLKQEHPGLVMVFCNTRKNADFLANNLKRYRLNAIAIHGGLEQNKRNKIMELFHANEVFILVCTDVAARGLDIKNVSHVYNYDSPKTSTEYIHRIGRTARAGAEGRAINLVSQRDYDSFARIKEDDSLNIKHLETPEIEELFVNFAFMKKSYFGGGRGGFRSGSEGRGRSFSGGKRGGERRSGGYRRPGGSLRDSGGSDSHRGGGYSGRSGGRFSSGSRGNSRGGSSRQRY